MIIINISTGESIEKALKRYKRKVENIGLLKELKRRKFFTKNSDLRREEIKKAKYIQTKNEFQ
jgi:small subunit ribosomal protein S21